MPESLEFKRVHRDPAMSINISRNLIVAAWIAAPQTKHFDRLRAVNEQMRHSYAGGLGFLNLMLKGKPSFSDEVRLAASNLARDVAPYRLGTAHVITMGGFVASTVMSFVGTILLKAGSGTHTKLCASNRAAAEFLVPLLNESRDCQWEVDAILELCDRGRHSVQTAED